MQDQSNSPRQLVSLTIAAKSVGVSERTIRRWIEEGRVTGYRVGAKLVRVDAGEIAATITVIPVEVQG